MAYYKKVLKIIIFVYKDCLKIKYQDPELKIYYVQIIYIPHHPDRTNTRLREYQKYEDDI